MCGVVHTCGKSNFDAADYACVSTLLRGVYASRAVLCAMLQKLNRQSAGDRSVVDAGLKAFHIACRPNGRGWHGFCREQFWFACRPIHDLIQGATQDTTYLPLEWETCVS